MSYRQNKEGRWYVKWHEEGKEKRQYFGFGDLAEKQARIFDDEIKRQKGKLKIDGGLTVSELCQLYHQQHSVQESTAKSDYYRLSQVILPILGDYQVETLSTAQLNEYVKTRIIAGRKRRTVDRELDVLKSAFSWAERQDPPLIVRNPVAKFRLSNADDSDVPFPPTQEEMQRIVAHSPDHLIRALLISWYLGIRPGGEVSRIKWCDVDFAGHKVRIMSARKGGPQTRYVPFKEEGPFESYLEVWREQDAAKITKRKDEKGEDIILHDFPLLNYRMLPVQSVKRSWATAKRKAGITRRMRLYDLRHAMATYALEHGADLKAVSQILGHSRPDTTLRHYQHVLDHQIRDAVQNIPDITIIRDVKKE